MAVSLRQIFVNVRLGTAQLQADFARVQKAFQKQFKTIGRNTKRIGDGITRNISIPLGLVGVGAAKAAIDFESAFAGVRKTVDATEEQFKVFSDEIKRLSTVIPASTTEIAGVAEAAGQLGIKNKNLIGFTETMIKLGATTNLSSAEAATALARFTNVTGLAQEDVGKLASAIVDLGNNFATTEAEIVEMASQLSGSGTIIGLTEADILAFSTALSSVGVRAERGGSAFSRVFKEIAKATETGGKSLEDFARIADKPINEFVENFKTKPAEAIQAFLEGFVRIKQEGGSAIQALDSVGLSGIRVSDSILRASNASGLFRKALERANVAIKDTSALDEEASKRFNTLASRITTTWNNLVLLGIEIGDTMRPAIEGLIKLIRSVTDRFKSWSEENKKAAVFAAGIAIALGPVLIAFGALLTFLGGPLLGAATAIIAVVAAGTAAWIKWGDAIVQWGRETIDKVRVVIDAFPELKVAINLVKLGFVGLKKVAVGALKLIASTVKFVSDNWFRALQAMAAGLDLLSLGVTKYSLRLKFAKQRLDETQKAHELYNKILVLQEKRVQQLSGRFLKMAGGVEGVNAKIKAGNELIKEWTNGLLSLGGLLKTVEKNAAGAGGGADDFGDRAKKAAEAIKGLKEQLGDLRLNAITKNLNDVFQKALDVGDFSAAKEIAEKLREQTELGVLVGLADAVEKGGAEAKKLAAVIAEETGAQTAKELKEQLTAAQTEAAKDLAKKQKDAMKESVDFWRNSFENAITGATFNLKDALKQVAVGFAAQIAAGMTAGIGGVMQGIKSPQDLGGAIAGSIFGGGSGAASGGLGGLLGGSGVGGLASGGGGILSGLLGRAPGVQGPLQADGSFGGVFSSGTNLSAGASAVGLLISISNGIDALGKIGKDTQATIKGGSTLVGTGIGAIFGGEIGAGIGSTVGKFAGKQLSKAFGGDTDPEANAREGFVSAINKLIKEVGGIKLIDPLTGGAVSADKLSIFGGRDKFDTEKGFSFFNDLNSKAQETFGALGESLAGVLELDPKLASQFGAILSENLLGDIDNARLFVQQLGLDFNELKAVILDTALSGETSWLEFNTSIRGLSEAFKPGLEAVGAVGQAFDNLLHSGGRGMLAVKSLRDLAVETLEDGGTSVEDLSAKLLASGKSAEDVQKIMDALAGRGVESLEQLVNASDELAGSIVGDLDAAGLGFEALTEDVKSVRDAFQELENFSFSDKQINLKVNVEGAESIPAEAAALGGVFSNIQTFARGGIINRPTGFAHSGGLGIAGEAGAEAILPLSRGKGGRLGVQVSEGSRGAGMTLNIDARGADMGVEQRLIETLNGLKESAVAEAVNAVFDAQERGRF